MVRKLLAAAAGAATARAVLRELRGLPALDRTNFRGRTVSLAGGPALAAGAAAGAFLGAAGRSSKTGAGRDRRAAAKRAAAAGGAAPLETARRDQVGRHGAGHAATGHWDRPAPGAADLGRAGRAVAGRAATGRSAAGRAAAGRAATGRAATGRAATGRSTAGRGIRAVDRSGRGPRVMGAVAVAGLGAGAVGLYDDLVGGRPEHAAKGFRGHLGALKEGRVTSGLVKIAGVGAAGLVAAAALLPGRRKVDVLLGAGVIAGAANLFNLLDLRPGRAIKAGIIAGTPLAAGKGGGAAAGALGAAGALLAADLGEEIMLGDAGANALGAVLGTAYVARTGTFGRLAALAGLVALTAASEKVSFTQVIERTPALRAIDRLGRLRPIAPPVMAAPPATRTSADATAPTETGTTAEAEAAEVQAAEVQAAEVQAAEVQAAEVQAAEAEARRRPAEEQADAGVRPKPSPRPRRDG